MEDDGSDDDDTTTSSSSYMEWAKPRQRSFVLEPVDLPGLDYAILYPSDSTLNTLSDTDNEASYSSSIDEVSSANKEKEAMAIRVDDFLRVGVWRDSDNDIQRQARKKVYFSDVTIREYALCLGEISEQYPIDGPPLSLDWAHTEERTISVNKYENRFNKSSLRRLDSLHRKFLLTVVGGYTEEDFRIVEKSKKKKFRKWRRFFRRSSKLSKC